MYESKFMCFLFLLTQKKMNETVNLNETVKHRREGGKESRAQSLRKM